MASMFDTIMNLPLFQGITREQLSLFLEKTQLSFLNYNATDTILKYGDPIDQVLCVISGEIKVCHKLTHDGSLTLFQTIPAQTVIAPQRLYGLKRTAAATVTANSDCCIMAFSKQQYQSLLQKHPIFLINYLNYLSLRAQKNDVILPHFPGGNLASHLSRIIAAYVDHQANRVEFTASLEALSRLTNLDSNTLKAQIITLQAADAIEFNNDSIIIKDYDALHRIANL